MKNIKADKVDLKKIQDCLMEINLMKIQLGEIRMRLAEKEKELAELILGEGQ